MKDISELLGCKYPIIQGAMGVICNPEFVAAVSEAGGYGILATAFEKDPGNLKARVDAVKALTDKPFGANLMPFHPKAFEFADILVEAGVKAVTTSGGSPKELLPYLKDRNIKVLHVVSNVPNAVKAASAGVDAVIAEGSESDSIIFSAKDPATGWNGLWFKGQADANTSRLAYCRFSDMKTDHDWHGVINAERYPRLAISHSNISDNYAHAINLVNSSISLDHTTLSKNSKGGVHSYASNPSLLNCRIIYNNSHGMYLNLSNPLIVNSIIANNETDALVLTAADPGIINSIIAKNGGRIEVENKPGDGARFSIFLPLGESEVVIG